MTLKEHLDELGRAHNTAIARLEAAKEAFNNARKSLDRIEGAMEFCRILLEQDQQSTPELRDVLESAGGFPPPVDPAPAKKE